MVRFVIILWVTAFALASPVVSTPASLIVFGKPIFTFRSRVGSIEPAERVKAITERINRLSADRLFDLSKIVVVEDKDLGWEIFAGDKLLMVVTHQDAKIENQSGKLIAEAIAFRLREVLAEDRFAKSPKELLIRGIYAVAYTIALILLLFGIVRLFRLLNQKAKTWQGTVIRSISIKNFELIPAERIGQVLTWLLGVLRTVFMLTSLYFFIPLVLSLFPWTEKLSPILLGYILNPLRQMGSGFIAFIPNLFFIAVTVVVTRFVLRFIRIFFLEIEKGNLRFKGFYRDWAQPTYQLVRVAVVAFSLVIVFPYIPGSNSPAFQGVSVFLGVLLSFGSTSAVTNTIAGLVLTYMRSFRIGDRVKIAETVGDIVEKNLLVTRIRTVKNVDITIPNSLVLNSHMVNYSSLALTDGLILNTEVTIGYDVPWRKVHELLINAALQTKGVLQSPSPFVYQTNLNDSYVHYEINVYTRNANGMALIYSELRQSIQDRFNEAGVEIMSPSYSALRDGNTVTIPKEKRPANYEAPSFRVSTPTMEKKVESVRPSLDV